MRLVLMILAVCLVGCGSTTDRQTKTVERLTTTTGPIIVDTPIGQFVAQPVRHEMTRSEHEVSTEQTRIDAPEVGQLISTVGNSTPWGGIISGIVGVGLAAYAGKRAMDAGRQRDELIDGIERAKPKLGDGWQELTTALEAEQSADTKRTVKARVG